MPEILICPAQASKAVTLQLNHIQNHKPYFVHPSDHSKSPYLIAGNINLPRPNEQSNDLKLNLITKTLYIHPINHCPAQTHKAIPTKRDLTNKHPSTQFCRSIHPPPPITAQAKIPCRKYQDTSLVRAQ